jgi:hypothetical protein
MGVEMIHRLLAILVMLLVAAPAIADVPPSQIRYGDNAVLYTMCDAEADDGVCQVGGDQVVANASAFDSLTFYSMQSAAGTYTCDVYSRDQTYDTTPGTGFKINTTSLSSSQEVITVSGPFMWVWVNCTAGTSATSHVTMLGRNNK